MKKFTLLLAIVASALLVASCGKTETPAKSDAAAAAQYPIDTCVVSDEKLGSMGEPVVINHDGTTVKFCCKACIDEFNEEPAKFVAKLKK